jgi:hypothetical protein
MSKKVQNDNYRKKSGVTHTFKYSQKSRLLNWGGRKSVQLYTENTHGVDLLQALQEVLLGAYVHESPVTIRPPQLSAIAPFA